MPAPDTVGVALITHHGAAHLPHSLPPLLASPLRPRVLVVDSSPDDATVREAQRLGAATRSIPPDQFNHGSTRELARRELGTPIVVMMSQDACLRHPDDLDRLIAPLRDGRASVAYGRQVPHGGAGFFESFPRKFNYPEESHIRSLADVETYGIYTCFCSDAFAAWRSSALDEVGGFPPTLSHEDAIVAARLIRAGHRIAYVADAVVEHSHRYTLAQEFRRYFDAGYARCQYRDDFAFAGNHGRLGRKFARCLFAELLRRRPWLLPYGVAHVGTKWLGYRLGGLGVGWPSGINRRLSGQKQYW